MSTGSIICTPLKVVNEVTGVIEVVRAVNSEPFKEEDLFYAARQQSSHHLGRLAQKIEPRYSWKNRSASRISKESPSASDASSPESQAEIISSAENASRKYKHGLTYLQMGIIKQ